MWKKMLSLNRKKTGSVRRRRKKQSGGFLPNRYDLAYVGRDTVNQLFRNLNNGPFIDKVLDKLSKKGTEFLQGNLDSTMWKIKNAFGNRKK